MVEHDIFSRYGIKVNRDKPWNTPIPVNKIPEEDWENVMVELGKMSRALSGANGSIPGENQDIMVESVHEKEVGVD